MEKSLGERIKEKRKADRLSAEDLAVMLGLKAGNIYKWERGSIPSDPVEYITITNWVNNLEPNTNYLPHSTEYGKSEKTYQGLLEENDRFFKTTFSELVANLSKLYDQGKNLESLAKLNLTHIGTVEALAMGVSANEIQAQINNEIANALREDKGTGAGT